MKKILAIITCCILMVGLKAGLVSAQTNYEIPPSLKAFEGLSIGGVAYIDYKAGKDASQYYNRFSLTRGYINIKKKITPWLSARITPDIHRSDNGDITLRIKYLYARFYFPNLAFLTNNFIEVGQIHIPWLDFKEAINGYRCQGTMLQERNHVFNSADQGIAWFGYFGGKISKQYRDTVDKHYAGKYGSFAVGVYNGAGYHNEEENHNKAIEGRITIRPIPNLLPGLQFSYFGIYGKGNVADNPPDWRVNTFYLSYETHLYTFTFTYANDKGCQSGTDDNNKEGISVFGKIKMPFYPRLELMARLDNWDPNTDAVNDVSNRTIVGIGYHIYKNNLILVDYERLIQDGGPDSYFFQTVLQVCF